MLVPAHYSPLISKLFEYQEIEMAEDSRGGGIGPLSFIVGGLVVAVAIGAFAYSGGYIGGHASQTTTERTTTTAPAAAPASTSTTTTTTEKTK
jgi:hypothetical protein